MATFRSSADVSGDDAIQANSFGGLNLTANPLNIPYEDSPDCLNVDITHSANVQKRMGTLLLKKIAQPTGFGMFTILSPLGNRIIVTKQGTSLVLYTYERAGLTTLMTKSNVFSSLAAASTPTFCEITAEGGDTKLLILTGTNVPIILSILDYSTTQASSTTSVAFTDAFNQADSAALADFAIFRWDSGLTEKAVTTASGFTASSGSYTLTGIAAPDYNALCYVSFITWQWVGEAKHWKGYRLWDRVSRYGAVVADRHVAVPETIRDELWENSSFTGLWPIRVYRTNAVNPSSQYTITVNPSLNTEYYWSDGNAAWTAGEYLTTLNAPLYATFGLYTLGGITVSSQSAAPVYFARYRRLNFNGGTGSAIQNMLCLSTNDWYTWGSVNYCTNDGAGRAGTTNGYALHAESNLNIIGNIATIGNPVSLLYGTANTGAQSLGTDFLWINKQPGLYVGSAAGTTPLLFPSALVDGRVIPWFGFGEYADYGRGYFPRVAVLINDRLALSSFPNDPGLVLFSEIADTLTPGHFYCHFQIDPFTESYGAFDIQTNAQRNDEIRAMLEFRGNIFLFTERTTLRLQPNDSGGYSLSTVSKTGIANARALAVSQNRVTIVNQAGVFELQQVEGLADSYAMVELSTKIAPLWYDASYSDRYYADWNEAVNKLYVTWENYLLVMDGLTGGWTRYLFANSETVEEVHYTLDIGGNGHMFVLIPYDETGGTGRAIIKLDHYTYLDFCQASNDAYPLANTSITTTNLIQLYKHNLTVFGIEDVQDLTVTLDGTPLTYGTQWRKVGNHSIFLTTNPGASKTLVITEKAVSPATARYIRTDGTLEYGLAYLSYFSTPGISAGKLGQYKRSLFFNALFNNGIANGMWLYGNTEHLSASLDAVEGYPKVPLDCHIAIRLNHAKQGETVYDLYNAYDLWYDYSRFDEAGALTDELQHVLIRTGIQGIGYDIQAYVWSWDETAFSMDGYQYDVKLKKGKRYVSE